MIFQTATRGGAGRFAFVAWLALMPLLAGCRTVGYYAQAIHGQFHIQHRQKPISKLSRGFRQRVGMAQALLHDPSVLILDEPTSGLDPNQLVGIRQLIKELGRQKTVLLSTHILQEVEILCDRVILIDEGKIQFDDSISKMGTREAMEQSFHKLTNFSVAST